MAYAIRRCIIVHGVIREWLRCTLYLKAKDFPFGKWRKNEQERKELGKNCRTYKI